MTITLNKSIFSGFNISSSWGRIIRRTEDDIYNMLLSDGYEGEDFSYALFNATDWKKLYSSISEEIVKSITGMLGVPLEFEKLLINGCYDEQIVLSFDTELLRKRISELSEVQTTDFDMYSNILRLSPCQNENIYQIKADIYFTALCLTLYSEYIHEDLQQSIDIGGLMHSCIRFEELKKYAPKDE